jgi:hypothetical protein
MCVALGAGLAARPAGAQDLGSFANDVLNLVNKERQAAGLAPLTRAVELDRAAQKYAQYMADAGFFSHNGPDGSTPSARIKAEGYSGYTWGENIAMGQPTPEAVMQAWMNSSGHRANILHSSFKEIGIGVAKAAGGRSIYWVQDFGARNGGGGGTAPPAPAKPSISTINPARGKVGDTIAVEGTNLGTSGQVLFGGGKAGAVQGWTSSRVSVKVPDGAKSGAVTVQNSVGTSNGFSFTVDPATPEQPPSPPDANPPPSNPPPSNPPGDTPPAPPTRRTRPRMSRVSPGSGKSGVLVTISGVNFGATPGRLMFGSTGGVAIQSWTDRQIKAVLTGTPGRRFLVPVRADGVPSANMAIFAIRQ